MIERVNTADIRRDFSVLLRRVEEAGEKVIICRYGKPAAALVAMPDLRRIWHEEDEELSGPVNPETGRRRGGLIRGDDLDASAPEGWAVRYAKTHAQKRAARRRERYEARKAAEAAEKTRWWFW